MYKLNDIIARPVISLYEAKSCGVVTAAVTDDRLCRILYFIVENGTDKRLCVSVKQIIFPIKDAVCIKNQGALEPVRDTPTNAIGKSCYEVNGRLIGVVDDLTFSSSCITGISVNGTLVSPSDVVKLNADMLLIRGGDKKYKPTPPRAVCAKLSPNPQSEVTMPWKSESEGFSSKTVDYAFLLGKKLTRSLGEKFREGQSVTKGLIADAEKSGELVKLALYAK